MSSRKTLQTVRITTAAEASRTACDFSAMPAMSSTTPKASHTAE